MPWDSGKTKLYENYMGDTQNLLGQISIGTGRTATPDQMYNTSKGMITPLLAWDLERRRQRAAQIAAYQSAHDARKKSGAGTITGIAKGVIGAGMMLTGFGAPIGAGLMASGIKDTIGGSGGGSGVAGINQKGGLPGLFRGGNFGLNPDYTQSELYPEASISFAEGGTITEPVVGKGVNSGANYLLGEEGPEEVTPVGEKGKQEQPDIIKSIWDLFSSEESPFKVDNKSQAMKSMDTKGGKEKNNGGAKSIASMSKGIGGVIKMLSAHYSGDTGIAKTGLKELVGAIADVSLDRG